MNRSPHIFAVGGDPGGAEALAPVLSALQGEECSLRVVAYRQAGSMWTSRGISCEQISEGESDVDCIGMLQDSAADLLLVATSVNEVNLERKFTAAAQQIGIPSVGVLDFWANYRERFQDNLGELTLVPDRVAVMDERARREMIAEGFDENRLIVTGQPAHEAIAAWRAKAAPGVRSRVRNALGIADSDLLVVFGSQPLASMAELCGHESDWLGYSERTVLPLVIDALETIAAKTGRKIVLLVRPHPREAEADYAGFISNRIPVIVSATGDRREVALAADLVAGMNSAYLAEACYLGCVTLSLQPGLRRPEALPNIIAGWTTAVYDAKAIPEILEQFLLEPHSRESVRRMRSEIQLPHGATQRILVLIGEILDARKPHLIR